MRWVGSCQPRGGPSPGLAGLSRPSSHPPAPQAAPGWAAGGRWLSPSSDRDGDWGQCGPGQTGSLPSLSLHDCEMGSCLPRPHTSFQDRPPLYLHY